MKVAVVTPTIGSEYLGQCIESIQKQTYDDLMHYIFVDGNEHFMKVNKNIDSVENKKLIAKVALDDNIGKGWYGHRVYAACSFLVNADIICYLDEDNWYEPCHVEKLVEKIKAGNDWAYSLRNIYNKEGDFICEDNCESLGKWPVYFNDSVFHIDTSSFAIKRDVAVAIGHAWYGQWGADRQFFGALKQHFPKYDCSKSYTLNYRLDGNPNSVTKEFFIEGNEKNKQKYGEHFPWKSSNLVSIGPGISIIS